MAISKERIGNEAMKVKVKKGDTVKILAGKDRGKTGVVERVSPKTGTVVVTGLNLVKRHVRPRRRVPHGGIVSQPAPLPIARVMVQCGNCGQPTRVAVAVDAEGRRSRRCKKCGESFKK